MVQGVVGRQIRMFLVDGTVGGLVTAEILNWTGHVLKGKRERLQQILHREEAGRTGVYILFGADPDLPGKRQAYIGQSDSVRTRLKSHDSNKDFWDEVVIITSKDTNLTSAHVRYLEAKLVEIATKVGRVRLKNSNVPTGGSTLPEADVSDMDYFIEQLKIILPVLGIDMLRGRQAQSTMPLPSPAEVAGPVEPETIEEAGPPAIEAEPSASPTDSPVFFVTRPQRGVDARAQVIDGEFTILSGSQLAFEMLPLPARAAASTRQQYRTKEQLREEHLASGELKQDSGRCLAVRDIVFSSPSTASAVALGTASSNGRVEWKTADGLTYADWETGKTRA